MPEVKCKFNRHSPLKYFQPGNMETPRDTERKMCRKN